MSNVKKVVDTLLNEDTLLELANLRTIRTGLPHLVWVAVNVPQQHHRPRLKVEGTDKALYPVSIDDPIEFLATWPPGWSARDFKDLQSFITLNRALLMAYWNRQIDTEDIINQVQSIRG
jgi:hypothetical protein